MALMRKGTQATAGKLLSRTKIKILSIYSFPVKYYPGQDSLDLKILQS